MARAPTMRPEVDLELVALLDEWEQERPRGLDPEATAYLVLVPLWTRELADRCKFPRRKPWDDFLAEAEAAGLAGQGPPGDAGEAGLDLRCFWMPEPARPGVWQQLAEQQGRDYLGDLVVRLARMIDAHQPGDPAVPALTRRWAELALTAGRGGQRAAMSKLPGKTRVSGPSSTGEAARVLSQRVAALADAGNIGEARAWIEAGETLASALGGELAAAVVLAKRRVEVANRRDVDRRYLARFIERDEQLAAFDELMTGPDDHWALHYLGMGGVGKTMLLRHIGYLAPEEYHSPVARVDFDYLNPDYPVRRPGQLLLALAEDLRRHFSAPEHQAAYQALHDTLLFLHEIIGEEPPPSRPLTNLRRAEFDDALVLFDALLAALLRTAQAAAGPEGPAPRVLLVLDTCEELVKAQAEAGGALPHLEATFEIIERVQRRMPSVRVILSGRRLLTLGGHGWRAATERLPETKSYLLPAKPYLRLHLIRGFDEAESQKLFTRLETDGRPLPPDVREAIVDASAEHGTPAALLADDDRPMLLPDQLYQRLRATLEAPAIQSRLDELSRDRLFEPFLGYLPASGSSPVRTRTEPEAAARAAAAIDVLLEHNAPDGTNLLVMLLKQLGDTGLAPELEALLTRYSPFSLTIYGQWYAEDRELTAERIRAGGPDPYVELRIVRRAQEQVRSLLPAVVLLRRFTQDMLAPAFTGTPDDYQAAFRALSDHEWLDYRRDPDTSEVWLEVDPNLHPRMLAYFEGADPAALAEMRRLLGAGLAEEVRGTPLRDQPVERITASLALLPASEAAGLWSEVEWRAPVEADWNWALKVARLALGVDAPAADAAGPLLLAALSATYTAANSHLSPAYDPAEGWRGVADWLERLDTEQRASPLARWLAARAAMGQAVDARLRGVTPGPEGVSAIRALLEDRATPSGPYAGLAPHQIKQLDAALLAALERLLDAAEEAGDRAIVSGTLDVDLFVLGEKALDARLRIFARLLEGRFLALQGFAEPALSALVAAVQLADEAGGDARKPRPWADWHAPVSMLYRVRLEWLRLNPDLPAADPAGDLPTLEQWLGDVTNRDALAQIDGERLASVALARLLDIRPASPETLAALETAYRYDPARQPACLAHRQTPPLFLTLARGWLALGEAARGDKLLRAIEKSATASAADPASVAATQRGLIEIARRIRDAERGRTALAAQQGQAWPEPDVWAMGALTGVLAADKLPAPDEAWDDARLHAWWRAQHSLTPERLLQASALVSRVATEERPEQDRTSSGAVNRRHLEARTRLILDAREADEIAGLEQRPTTEAAFRLAALASAAPADLRPSEAWESLRLLVRWIALEAFPVTLVDRVAELEAGGWLRTAISSAHRAEPLLSRLIPGPVGTRRAAEIALDEGELLALRLPARATALLRQAHAWFVAAGDPVGAVQAAILWALAAIRAEASGEAGEALVACRSAYEGLAAARPDDRLPEWAALQTVLLGPPDQAALAWTEGSSWRGWLARLAVCLLWEQLPGAEAGPIDWTAIAASVEGRLRLGPTSPEMLPTGQISQSEALQPAPGCLSTSRGMLLVTAGGLLLLAVLLVGGYLGFRALLVRLAPPALESLGTGVTIGLYGAALLLLAAAVTGSRWLRRGVRAWLASRTAVDCDIRPSAPSAADPVLDRASASAAPGMTVRIRVQSHERHLRIWPPFLQWGTPQSTEETTDLPASGPTASYAAAAGALAGKPTSIRLAELARRAGRRGLVTGLSVMPDLAAYPWEAWLGLAVAQEAAPPATLRLYRSAAAESGRGFAPGGVRVAVDETWAGLFEAAWGSSRAQRADLSAGPGAHLYGEKEAVRVLHVVGRPMMTRGGPRIQVESGGHEAVSYEQKAPSRAAGELLGAAELARPALCEAGRLVVLQATPLEGVAGREVARNEMVILRRLGAETFAAGVPAVLVLPGLPAGLAGDSAQHLARALAQLPARRARDLVPWLVAVDRIRRDIVTWRPPEGFILSGDELAASLAELAWEVTLFWRQILDEEAHRAV